MNQDNRIRWFRNDGTGSFVEPPTSVVAGGVHPSEGGLNFPLEVAVVDVDGDGRLDVAYLHAGLDAAVSFSRSLGGGEFGDREAVWVSPAGTPVSFAFGDTNGDGAVDFAILTPDGGGVVLAKGAGGGAFETPVQIAAGGAVADSGKVTGGDANGDGLADFWCAGPGDSGPAAVLLRNLGAANGTVFEVVPVSYDPSPAVVVAAADADGDGDEDALVVFRRSTGVDLPALVYHENLEGEGAGGFAPGVVLANVQSATAGALADMDGDGYPDVVAASYMNGGQEVLEYRSRQAIAFAGNDGDAGGYTEVVSDSAAVGPAGESTYADVNGDGYAPFVFRLPPAHPSARALLPG